MGACEMEGNGVGGWGLGGGGGELVDDHITPSHNTVSIVLSPHQHRHLPESSITTLTLSGFQHQLHGNN